MKPWNAAKKLEWCILILVKLSIEFGTRVFCINWNQSASETQFQLGLRVTSLIVSNTWLLMDSHLSNVSAGVPQGSVLGPLLFLIYINDVTVKLKSDCLLYADNTSLSDIVDDPVTSSLKLNNDLTEIKDWVQKWLVTINPTKTE